MKIPLPNLDDRRWVDLVDEGRALIPLYAPEWTDHNIHDPGITLLELLAWVTEMDIYQLNRISDRAKRKFLSLVGVAPRPPRGARTVLSFGLIEGAQATLSLAAGIEFASREALGQAKQFRLLTPVTIAPGRLVAVQFKDGKRFNNATDLMRKGESFGVFGPVPQHGAELYLGFSEPLPQNEPCSLFFNFYGTRYGEDERRRIIEEVRERKRACGPPQLSAPCKSADAQQQPAVDEKQGDAYPLRRVRTEWEFLASAGPAENWVRLDPQKQEVDDDTRNFTLDGQVVFKIPAPMAKKSLGQVGAELYYLRCRFEAGDFDAPPRLGSVAMNGVRAEQSVPVSIRWSIAAGVTASGPAPAPGSWSGLSLQFTKGEITKLGFIADASPHAPQFLVLDYQPSSETSKGALSIEAKFLGDGTGGSLQELVLPDGLADESSFRLYTLEGDAWHSWQQRPDFDASTGSDLHFLLDPTAGTVSFGDGKNGRVPPPGALVFAAYRITQAEVGNLGAGAIDRLSDSPHNRSALLQQFTPPPPDAFNFVKGQLVSINNPIPATGGAAAELLTEAEGRAIELMQTPRRAVTLSDYERLAKETPGARLARVTAWANLHPGFTCLKAPGMITVIILPDMPVPRPSPSPRLRRAVSLYLQQRRIIGTRVEVVGPEYTEVAVRARVQSFAGINKANLQQKIIEAVDGFFDPLHGGPSKTGWPFGRDIYRSEVLQLIDEVPGVDHVLSLEFIVEGCKPQCGNVCLSATGLVAAGQHEIAVV
jgi:hypothetical protein